MNEKMFSDFSDRIKKMTKEEYLELHRQAMECEKCFIYKQKNH